MIFDQLRLEMKIDFTIFEESLERLKTFNAEYRKAENITSVQCQMFKLGVIRAFMLCYNATISVMNQYLKLELGLQPGIGEKTILKCASDSFILGAPIERWMDYTDGHNKAKGAFEMEVIDEIMELIPDFIVDATSLYRTMESRQTETETNDKVEEIKCDTIDLKQSELSLVKSIFSEYLPDTLVWAYGSRVRHTSTYRSDLDLVLFASKAQRYAIFELREALEESNFPYLVDLHVWNEIPEHFKPNIKRAYYVLQEGLAQTQPS